MGAVLASSAGQQAHRVLMTIMCLSGHMLWPEVATRRPSPARDSQVAVEPLHGLFRNLTPRAAGPSAGLARWQHARVPCVDRGRGRALCACRTRARG
eukprot:scaffold3030_cov305-Prasinococcus_capsulatus_cf.AAC.7